MTRHRETFENIARDLRTTGNMAPVLACVSCLNEAALELRDEGFHVALELRPRAQQCKPEKTNALANGTIFIDGIQLDLAILPTQDGGANLEIYNNGQLVGDFYTARSLATMKDNIAAVILRAKAENDAMVTASLPREPEMLDKPAPPKPKNLSL